MSNEPVKGRAKVAVRTVLFATGTAAPEIPVAQDFPAALLPMGCSTFIERTLEQLSNAGVRQLDLVVSSHPEQLRRLLSDGERWGLSLRWHLVKDPAHPYGILRSLGLEPLQRVLLGHADRWIADEALESLVQRDQVLTQSGSATSLNWAGWASVAAGTLNDLAVNCNEYALGLLLMKSLHEMQMLEPNQFILVRDARQFLEAQRIALSEAFMQQVPATWLRQPWGAHSPDALVQSGALIDGPTLIGPGCMVATGARIGPFTVLTSDIVVSTNSTVRNSVVLPHTYVGEGLELDQTIVNARSVQHLVLGVRTVLPISEGLLMDLRRKRNTRTSWLARLLALLACLIALPWLALDSVVRRWRSLPLRWSPRSVVLGQDADSGQLLTGTLRCPNATETGFNRLLSNYGAWLDVVAGQRSWFGARPRTEAAWLALSRDWQLLLANTPVGCLHAPAWSDADGENPESLAAADVFFAVRQSPRERLRLLAAALRGSGAD
jgi:hypothetical protein